MSPYIEVPIETEPVDLAEEAFGYIEEQVPGWLPSPGNLEAWLIEALSQTASELRELTALVPDAIFQYFGTSILGLPPHAATQATGTTTWTAVDNAGYTVDAGTLVGITPPASDDTYAFEVIEDFAIAAGSTSTAGVVVQAIEAGADASGITGTVEMLDPLDFISTVALNVPTSGGTDAEEIDAYLDRLSDLATLLAPRPILPQDFAVMAQRQFPEVGRAVAIDLYDPGPPPVTNKPRCTTVVVVGPDGQPVSSTVKADVDAYLEARREVNFLVFVADPTYTTIDVTFDVTAYPGYVTSEVQALVIEALTTYLSPGGWGLPPYGDLSAQSWINETKVRYLEVAEMINRTDGVHFINTLTIRQAGGTMGTTDITLTGVAPLPQPGAIAGTVQPG